MPHKDKHDAPKRWRVKGHGDDLITYWKSKPRHTNEYAAAEIIEELESELAECKGALTQEHDIRVTREAMLQSLAEALGVAGEPHQTFDERLLEAAQSARAPIARPGTEWHEDMGSVIWWRLPVNEPPWVGSPLDADWPLIVGGKDYYTHFTPLVVPANAKDKA